MGEWIEGDWEEKELEYGVEIVYFVKKLVDNYFCVNFFVKRYL